jgi:predicted hotdog family 3-hydroxylacyl-ACP dehydratase
MSGTRYPPVTAVLPHAGSMVLLTRIVQHADDHTVCAVDVSTASAFHVPAHGVPAWVGVEYMAQCIAAHGGLRAWTAREPVPVGVLLGSRAIEFHAARFVAGQTLNVDARRVWGRSVLFAFACSVTDAATGAPLVTGSLTVRRADPRGLHALDESAPS